MAETFYKATQPNGTDFYTGTIDYARALETGEPITLPTVDDPMCCTGTVLHASRYAGSTLSGGSWPCRLFEVTGTPVTLEDFAGRKCGFFELTVTKELNPHRALGPQGAHVAMLMGDIFGLGLESLVRINQAWSEANTVMWRDAYIHAEDIAYRAYRTAALWSVFGVIERNAWVWDTRMLIGRRTPTEVIKGAAAALLIRDRIDHRPFLWPLYDILSTPWRKAIGTIHPDDEDIRKDNSWVSTP